MNSYIKEFIEKIGKKFKEREEDKQYSDDYLINLKMEQEMIDMAISHLRKVKKKKEKINHLKRSLEEKRNLLKDFNSFILDTAEKLQEFNKHNTNDPNLYSPINNTKALSSLEVLNYASDISYVIHAPEGRVDGDDTPFNFYWPVPWPNFQITPDKSLLAYNSTLNGKPAKRCSTPKYLIVNDDKVIDNRENKYIHMRTAAEVRVTYSDPPDSIMKYTTDGSVPNPFRGNDVANGSTIKISRNCSLKIITTKQFFVESEVLELIFKIENQSINGSNDAEVQYQEYVQRPELKNQKKVKTLETLDTPSSARTPHTPNYLRTSSSKEN